MSANWGDVELLVKHRKVGLSKTGSTLNDWPSYQLQPHYFESAQLEIRDFSSPSIFACAHHEAKQDASVQARAAHGCVVPAELVERPSMCAPKCLKVEDCLFM